MNSGITISRLKMPSNSQHYQGKPGRDENVCWGISKYSTQCPWGMAPGSYVKPENAKYFLQKSYVTTHNCLSSSGQHVFLLLLFLKIGRATDQCTRTTLYLPFTVIFRCQIILQCLYLLPTQQSYYRTQWRTRRH